MGNNFEILHNSVSQTSFNTVGKVKVRECKQNGSKYIRNDQLVDGYSNISCSCNTPTQLDALKYYIHYKSNGTKDDWKQAKAIDDSLSILSKRESIEFIGISLSTI